ncbi:MAG TPA: hypothetical protein VGF75_05110 [Candidatus Saccharimonadales bacterium]|jgi:hypothetical protein
MRDPNTRHWAECSNPDCSDWKSAESMDAYWADAEGSKHLLQFRLTDEFTEHVILIMHREVISA